MLFGVGSLQAIQSPNQIKYPRSFIAALAIINRPRCHCSFSPVQIQHEDLVFTDSVKHSQSAPATNFMREIGHSNASNCQPH